MKVFQGLHPQNSHQGPALDPLEGGEGGGLQRFPQTPQLRLLRASRVRSSLREYLAPPQKKFCITPCLLRM